MNDPVLVALITGATFLLGGIITLIGTRGKTKTDHRTAFDQRIDERVDKQLSRAWAQLDLLEEEIEKIKDVDRRKMGAVARIFRTIQRQWPTPDGPDLDPNDIAEIEEALPIEWIRRPFSPSSVGE